MPEKYTTHLLCISLWGLWVSQKIFEEVDSETCSSAVVQIEAVDNTTCISLQLAFTTD